MAYTGSSRYSGFAALKGQLSRKGAKTPGALAAAIGRAKYGKKAFQKAAAKGKLMRGAAPAKNKAALFRALRKGKG